MSCVNASTKIEIELTDFEKDHLIHTYRILKNLESDMWNEGLEECEEYWRVTEAKENLRQVLKYAGVDDYED